jgi:zinc protease
VKRSLLFLILLCSLVLNPSLAISASPQRAQPQAKTPKTAPPPTSASAPLAEAAPLVNKVLPNGLEVIVLEDHSVPLVTVELAVRNGAFTEPPELNGLSHLFEHMFFKVTTDAAIRF